MGYLVLTEEWYGGGLRRIRCFKTRQEAQEYQNTLDVDSQIIECTINRPFLVVTEEWFGGLNIKKRPPMFPTEDDAKDYAQSSQLDTLIVPLVVE